jgi:phage terminase large subunit-like protein
LSTLIDDALTNADPTIKCILYSVPIEDDPFDKKVLAKAQPNWHLMNHTEVFKQATDAKRMVSRENSFRNLVCNQRVESKNPFITRGVWLDNAAQPEDIAGRTVYAGLDLSSVSDLTALVLVSETGDVVPTFWLPGEGLKEKAGHDRVPYDIWVREGYLLTTPGRAIEYEYIAEYLRGLFDRCNVAQLAFDRYNMRFLRPWLERVGFTEEELSRFVEFGQGFVSMSPALRELESQLLSKKLKHGGHPVLTMCAANAVAVEGPTAGTRKFAKVQANSRIDGMVALAMAVGVMPNEATSPSIYETQELRTF